jgi:hypothetical protein
VRLGIQTSPPGYRTPLHSHPYMEALMILEGAGEAWMEGSDELIALTPGMILTFKDGRKQVATGEVTAVHEGEMIAAKLTTGSFKKVKHPERLEVTAEPRVFSSPPVLRVGYPASGRKNYLFDCRRQAIGFSLRHYIYQVPFDSVMTTGPTYRLLREQHPSSTPWPPASAPTTRTPCCSSPAAPATTPRSTPSTSSRSGSARRRASSRRQR